MTNLFDIEEYTNKSRHYCWRNKCHKRRYLKFMVAVNTMNGRNLVCAECKKDVIKEETKKAKALLTSIEKQIV